MSFMSMRGRAAMVLAAAGLAVTASAQSQFVIDGNSVINGTAGQYIGPNSGGFDLPGAVVNGGIGAYDFAGLLFFGNNSYNYGGVAPAGLSISRQTDTLQNLNVFRWVVTLTNNSASTITTPVSFFTRIGYDPASYTDVNNDPFRFVTYQNRVLGTVVQADIPGRPVIGMMHGNNALTFNNITWDRNLNDPLEVVRRWNMSLAPGQSQTFMFADFLAFTLDANGNAGSGGQPGDIALAMDTTAAYLGNAIPLFQGLDAATIGAISNWTGIGIPTPGAAGVLALGGLVAARRRR